MKEASSSVTERHEGTARQIRIMRLCRLPLVAALALVGAHGATTAFERLVALGPPAAGDPVPVAHTAPVPDPNVPTSIARLDPQPRPEPPVDFAHGTDEQTTDEQAPDEQTVVQADVPEQMEAPYDPEAITCLADSIFVGTDQATDDGQEEPQSLVLDSTPDAPTPPDDDLTGGFDGTDELADWPAPLFDGETSLWTDGAAMMDPFADPFPAEIAEVVPGGEAGDEMGADVPSATPERTKSAVLLINDTQEVLHYLVDGVVHSLGPGETHDLGSDGPWKIQFHRGADFGNADHTIAEGVHAFRLTESGWGLEKASISEFP